MNNKALFYGAIFFALISVCLLFILQIEPTVKIWDRYNVLYVDIHAEIDLVRNALQEENIEGVLYPDHKGFPSISTLAPVQHIQFSNDFTYEQLQDSYFFDKDKNYYLYYIPQDSIKAVYKALETLNYSWGVDSNTAAPILPCLVSSLLIIYLFFRSKSKLFYASILFPFILYSYVAPYYHIAASVSIFAVSVFTIQKLWKRKFLIFVLQRNIIFMISIPLLLIASFLLGAKGFLLLLLTCILSMSAAYIVYQIYLSNYNSAVFQPTLIHTAKTIRIEVNKINIIIVLFLLIILTIFSIINIQPFEKNTKKALHLPSPSGYTMTNNFSAQNYVSVIDEFNDNVLNRLPDLTDYISAAWHNETYPYIKLGNAESKTLLLGETVEHTQYIKDGFTLEERKELVAIFDEAYIQRVISTALTGSNAGAEKLLAEQKGFTRVAYAQNGEITTPTGSVVFLLLSCMFITYIFIMLRLKRL